MKITEDFIKDILSEDYPKEYQRVLSLCTYDTLKEIGYDVVKNDD